MKNTNLIIGKINSGKTRGVLVKEVKNLIDNNENLLILDNKKEYYGTYSKYLSDKGYNVLLVNLDEPTKSNGFNPLNVPYYYYKNGDIDMAINLIDGFAHSIFSSNNTNADPFWENMASAYFSGLVQILFREGKDDEINLGSVSMISSIGEKKYGDSTILKKYLDNINPLDPIYVSLSPTVYAPQDTKGSIISVMKEKLNSYLMRPNLLNLLNTSEIKLNELKDKTAIFIIGKQEYNSLSNVLISELTKIVEKNKIKFTYVLDNFDTLPTLIGFKNLIENATYNNLKVYATIKTKEEFEQKYGNYVIDKFENIINVDNIVELGNIGNDNEYPKLEFTDHKYFDLEKIIK